MWRQLLLLLCLLRGCRRRRSPPAAATCGGAALLLPGRRPLRAELQGEAITLPDVALQERQ
jgi:hypothetical protein